MDGASNGLEGIEGFDALPVSAYVEAARLCPGCGYGLTGQAIRRDPRSGVLLVRCSECGHYEPAQSLNSGFTLWGKRFGLVFALVLAGLVIGPVIGALFATLVTWVVTVEAIDDARLGHRYVPPVGVVIACGVAASSVMWAVLMVFLRIVLPHWPRVVLLLVVPSLPTLMLAAFTCWFMAYGPVRDDTPLLEGAVWVSLGAWLGALSVAGVMHRLARVAVRVLIPPPMRGPLAYLWYIDGLDAPIRPPWRVPESVRR